MVEKMKKPTVTDEYENALNEILARVQKQLKGSKPHDLPIKMYIAGGAALHLLTGERVTEDIDATFSKKVLFSEPIEVSYRAPDGRARLMYLDRTYNDTLGLLHEDAYTDSQLYEKPGIDKRLIEVRVLAPLDLAVSKLGRFSDQDREDIELLAKKGLIDSSGLRARAEDALQGCVGDTGPVRTSIDIACRLVDAFAPNSSQEKRKGEKPNPKARPPRRGKSQRGARKP
jgi:hypothetical protein